jgi:import inner membrane translocase subunit TIM17
VILGKLYISLCKAYKLINSPYVILNDFGGAFAMGAIGGGIWHGIKGARNSPRGERLVGSLSAIKARAPVLGGNFGVWGGLFSSYDCAVKGYRQKEDPWNAITAGFLTGGTLAFRCELDLSGGGT